MNKVCGTELESSFLFTQEKVFEPEFKVGLVHQPSLAKKVREKSVGHETIKKGWSFFHNHFSYPKGMLF